MKSAKYILMEKLFFQHNIDSIMLVKKDCAVNGELVTNYFMVCNPFDNRPFSPTSNQFIDLTEEEYISLLNESTTNPNFYKKKGK